MSALDKLIKDQKSKMEMRRSGFKKTAKLATGKNIIRILPSWRRNDPNYAGKDEAEQFWHEFSQHYIKDASGAIQAVAICKAKTYEQPCEICDALSQAAHEVKSTGDQTMLDRLNEAKSGRRVLVNALIKTSGSPNEVVILELPPKVFEDVLTIVESYGDVTDTDEGQDLLITKEGSGLNTKYSVVPVPPKNNVKVVDKTLLTQLNNIDHFVQMQANPLNEPKALASLRVVAALPALTPAARAAGVAAGAFGSGPVTSKAGNVLDDEDDITPSSAPASADDLEDLLSDLP